MSKKIGVEIVCPNCQKSFETDVFRSLWIEEPENRRLVFEDRVNAVKCPHCNTQTKLDIPLLCTNVKKKFAVWYEPYHDEAIDKDVAGYKAMLGPNNFYSNAPRLSDWNQFKNKIVEYESHSDEVGNSEESDEILKAVSGFVNKINRETETENTFTYPKPLDFMADHKRRFKYSLIPFSLIILTMAVKHGPVYTMNRVINDFDGFITALPIFTLFTFLVLTLIHYGLMEIIPNWLKRKEIRLWSFCSGCWVIAVPLFVLIFDPYDSSMYEEEWIHMWSVTFIPPLFIGIGGYIYEKYIK